MSGWTTISRWNSSNHSTNNPPQWLIKIEREKERNRILNEMIMAKKKKVDEMIMAEKEYEDSKFGEISDYEMWGPDWTGYRDKPESEWSPWDYYDQRCDRDVEDERCD